MVTEKAHKIQQIALSFQEESPLSGWNFLISQNFSCFCRKLQSYHFFAQWQGWGMLQSDPDLVVLLYVTFCLVKVWLFRCWWKSEENVMQHLQRVNWIQTSIWLQALLSAVKVKLCLIKPLTSFALWLHHIFRIKGSFHTTCYWDEGYGCNYPPSVSQRQNKLSIMR